MTAEADGGGVTDRDAAIAAWREKTGKTPEQAEAFFDLMKSAFARMTDPITCKVCGHDAMDHNYAVPIRCRECPDGVCQSSRS